MNIERIILLSALLLCAIGTGAQVVPANQVKLTWAHPTQYVDGTPLPQSAIQKYFVQWNFNDSEIWNQFPELGVTTGFVHGNLAPGKYCYRLIITVRDIPSLPSNEVCKVILPVAPKPPVLSIE